MQYVLLLCLLVLPATLAWDCSSHLIIMQIALQGLSTEEQSKMEQILSWMPEKDANFSLLESACFSEDMTASGFTALDLWKSYERPFYDGIEPKDAKFMKPVLDSYHAIVS